MNGSHDPACTTYEQHVDRLIADGEPDRFVEIMEWVDFAGASFDAEDEMAAVPA